MEPVWHHILTTDYERTRPDGTLLEWDLYTTSLPRWPAILMDDPRPYGYLRRPGIVDIDEANHTVLVARWHALLRDPAYTASFIERTTSWHRDTAQHLNLADIALSNANPRSAHQHLSEATTAFLKVMSTHIVNWLLPEDDWTALLRRLLGAAAEDCQLALMTPSGNGHLLGDHLQTLTTPDDAGDPGAGSATITATRARAGTTAQSWATAALLAAAGDPDAVTQVQLVTALLTWAADSEENRAILRRRYLAAAPRWANLVDRDPAALTVHDFDPEGALR